MLFSRNKTVSVRFGVITPLLHSFSGVMKLHVPSASSKQENCNNSDKPIWTQAETRTLYECWDLRRRMHATLLVKATPSECRRKVGVRENYGVKTV